MILILPKMKTVMYIFSYTCKSTGDESGEQRLLDYNFVIKYTGNCNGDDFTL